MDEDKGLLDLGQLWPALLLAVLIFSVTPHLVMHLLLLLYPKGHKRRDQLIADLFDVPRRWKPFWVAEMALMVIFEAVPIRISAYRKRRHPREAASQPTVKAGGPTIAEERRMRAEQRSRDNRARLVTEARRKDPFWCRPASSWDRRFYLIDGQPGKHFYDETPSAAREQGEEEFST